MIHIAVKNSEYCQKKHVYITIDAGLHGWRGLATWCFLQRCGFCDSNEVNKLVTVALASAADVEDVHRNFILSGYSKSGVFILQVTCVASSSQLYKTVVCSTLYFSRPKCLCTNRHASLVMLCFLQVSLCKLLLKYNRYIYILFKSCYPAAHICTSALML